tara:strand:- start:175 stop:528 length:354 start_codon:yes stop_codon:yes gene_type:complete
MAVTFTKIYTSRVEISPKATLGDGTEVTDYVDAMVMEIQGVSGSLSATRSEWVAFANPSTKTASDYVAWSSLSAASRPTWVTSAMTKFQPTVTADVVAMIEAQFNAPEYPIVTGWAS